MIGLVLLLSLLGAPPLPDAQGVAISFQTDGPPGIYGVACHSSFREVEGHAQALCGDLPDNTAVIYVDEIDSRALLLNVLAHENAHLRFGVGGGETAWERFREQDAYAEGCRYSWHRYCPGWGVEGDQ